MRCSRAAFPWLATAAAASVIAKPPSPGADGKYTISAPGIKAQFIPYGATLTNLFVKDKDGNDVDVVLGYEDINYYPEDPGHPVYNSIPGRYVNRIGKGKYEIDGKTYTTQLNDGSNTLHSGTNNWSYRVWSVAAATDNSITFEIRDESNSSQGMLGLVNSKVTYSVRDSTWDIKIEAASPEQKTPLMLTQHTYFNLDAYRNPDQVKIWNHTLYMPYSKRYLVADDAALPTGRIATAAPDSINDFASREGLFLGHAQNDPRFAGNCGAGGACEGYNGYWLIDDAPKDAVVVSLASEFSGITADLRTDQSGVVIYSCNWMDGSASLKKTQGTAANSKVVRSSCVAIEAHDYVDGINHPEWGRVDKQIIGPGQTYAWKSSWTFRNL
ncbi:galactose mutarotase-like protein [Durotheca rogersii]|uniref:galactose mutarotase-like protein n=1 Tax=Durotheca rogersii TaxID=419775 RepID=UPI00221FB339|nr:galactose mutarotase-like protein [Durotheca rogersii]KAI5864384.1 galactose mutarotase-like protein [Durotheca rogersii]